MHKLTVKQVSSYKGPGRLSDGGNLYLAAKDATKRSWLFIFKSPVTGKQREMGLGSVQAVTLAEAREMAAGLRKQLEAGVDPIEARRAGSKAEEEEEEGQRLAVVRAGTTFGDVADEYIALNRNGWRNDKHAAQWVATLRDHAAALRPKLVAELDTDDVVAVLKPIWLTTHETARRLRSRIEMVLEYARAKGFREASNVAAFKGHLQFHLPRPTDEQKRPRGPQRSLPYAEIPALMAALRAQDNVGVRALEFLILNASRATEAAEAQWAEVDEKSSTWTLPPSRMKAKLMHRVPIMSRVGAIIEGMKEAREGESKFVFPGRKRGKPLTAAALTNALELVGFNKKTSVHGLRASFRTWAEEKAAQHGRDLAEVALAHKVYEKTEGVYQRSDLLEKRRALMADWERFCLGGVVIAMPMASEAA